MNYEPISLGSSGKIVTYVQSLLKLNGYYPAIITGVYGPDTEYFVNKFQKDYDLEVTGTINKETFYLLESLLKKSRSEENVLNYPTISVGSNGEYVVKAQSILSEKLYYDQEISGIFDNNFKTSVQTFQIINKLIPDGIIGKDTWSALIYYYSPLSSCESKSNDNLYYTVKPGDTLYSIAKSNNISINELKELNNLKSDILSVGQILKLKSSDNQEETLKYIVKAGDTLYSIAKKYNVSVSELKTINNLPSDNLSIGQTIYIKDEENNSENNENTYTVKAGDTLYSIAKKFNMNVDNLKELNNLNSNILSIGQTLKVKNSSNELNEYTVKSGDTLYSIAKKLGTTVSNIQSKNNLISNLISIGQVLKY